MELLVQNARLAEAENLIVRALTDRHLNRTANSILLVLIFTQQGRVDDARRWIEGAWKELDDGGEGASEQAVDLVRMYIELETNTPTPDAVKAYLDQAYQRQPEDDRVWLGKAILAIRTGAFDEAARWLAACLHRRPLDQSVWRTKLRWAMATNRVAEMQEALSHLPASESSGAEIHRLAAWLAAAHHDGDSEKHELERMLEEDPADERRGFDRLTELAPENRSSDRIAESARRKAETRRLRDRYRVLYERNQPSRDCAEMARIAEQLGRRFEARVFATLALADDPTAIDLRNQRNRLNAHADDPSLRGRTLADVLVPRVTRSRRPGPTAF